MPLDVKATECGRARKSIRKSARFFCTFLAISPFLKIFCYIIKNKINLVLNELSFDIKKKWLTFEIRGLEGLKNKMEYLKNAKYFVIKNKKEMF